MFKKQVIIDKIVSLGVPPSKAAGLVNYLTNGGTWTDKFGEIRKTKGKLNPDIDFYIDKGKYYYTQSGHDYIVNYAINRYNQQNPVQEDYTIDTELIKSLYSKGVKIADIARQTNIPYGVVYRNVVRLKA